MNNPDVAADLPPLRLKKREDRRLRAGHLWVFSNEVDIGKTPLTDFQPGEIVQIISAEGRPVGTGYVNPHSLISARLVSRKRDQVLNASLIKHRLNIALSLRERLFDRPFYRLCFGESDGLPGLVIDRYGDVLVAQFNTAGMEVRRDEVVAVLAAMFRPRSIILRNDSGIRQLEGLDSYVTCAHGEEVEKVEIEEAGARFSVPVVSGQKTGWFYDQRDNRQRLRRYVSGQRVLDVFSYVGAWGVQAALAGAEEVVCVDASRDALAIAETNAAANGVADKMRFQQGDAFEVLSSLRAEREHFDVVVVDPPAFIKRRKNRKSGEQAYRRLNQMAMQVLSRDGILVSASCSAHLERARLASILYEAARHVDRGLQILEQGHQAPDHPVHPAIPETDYLKAYVCRVLPT